MAKNKGIEQSLAVQEERPVQVAVYVRVSSEEQRDKETIQSQIGFAERYCAMYSLSVFDFYKDDGVTGTIALEKRPGGKRLLDDAAHHKFDQVLVYKIDRLARKTLVLLNAFEAFDAMGVGLRSMNEAFDTSTSSGKFTMTMFASIATLERETILERTALGRQRKTRQGKWVFGGAPPFGYRVTEDQGLAEEPKEADTVRTVFRLYTQESLSMMDLAAYLNARNVPAPASARDMKRAGQWRATTVSRILSSSAYIGSVVVPVGGSRGDQEKVTLEAPPLVTLEMWKQAEALREANRKSARRNMKREYLLRGLIRCGECGSTYAGDGRTDRATSYYRCVGKSNVSGRLQRPCTSSVVRAEELDDFVWQDIMSFIRDPGPLVRELEAKVRHEMGTTLNLAREIESFDRDMAAKSKERERVITLYRKGSITDEDVDRELAALGEELKLLEDGRNRLVDRQHEMLDLETHATTAQILLERLRDKTENATFETKRQLVLSLVEKIIVDTVIEEGRKTPKVTIRYRFPHKDPDGGDQLAYCVSPAIQSDIITEQPRAAPLSLTPPMPPVTVGKSQRGEHCGHRHHDQSPRQDLHH